MSNYSKRYSEEFKVEAIELAKKIGVSKAEKELGVSNCTIRKWVNALENGSQTSKPRSVSELESEIRRLRKENGYLKKINEVLKKSTAIFSNDHFIDSK